jgi:hypothetical protein
MKITQEFIDNVAMQRNLLSAIKNMVFLAKAMREIQESINELQQKVGIPRRFQDEAEK